MSALLEGLRSPDEPAVEEFVDAVIQTHERMRSDLRAMLRGEAHRNAGTAAAEARIIRAYNLSHGIDAGRLKEIRRAAPRWLAVSAR